MVTDMLSLDSGKSKPFYVYLYRDPRPRKDNQPIYVGKGSASYGRANVHWIHGARNPFLKSVLSKVRKAGLKPIIEIVEWFDDEESAHVLEMAMIANLGRRDLGRGPLLNLTDGGEGVTGLIVSEEARLAHRQNGQEMWATASEAKRAAMSKCRDQWEDPDLRASRSAKMKAVRAEKWSDPLVRAAHIQASVVTKRANAGRTSAQVRDYYANETPEKRAERVAALTAARQADAEATGARSKEMWSRPGQTEKQSQAIKAGQLSSWADPEKRARRLEKIRATRALKKASKPLAAV